MSRIAAAPSTVRTGEDRWPRRESDHLGQPGGVGGAAGGGGRRARTGRSTIDHEGDGVGQPGRRPVGPVGRLAWNVTIDWNEPRASAASPVTAIDRNWPTRTAASAGTIAEQRRSTGSARWSGRRGCRSRRRRHQPAPRSPRRVAAERAGQGRSALVSAAATSQPSSCTGNRRRRARSRSPRPGSARVDPGGT